MALEGYFQKVPGFGVGTMTEVKKMVAKTLDLSLNKADVRYSSVRLRQNWGKEADGCIYLQGMPSQKR